MKPITEVARKLGLDPAHLEPYGSYKGKIALAALGAVSSQPAAGSGPMPTPDFPVAGPKADRVQHEIERQEPFRPDRGRLRVGRHR